MNVSVIPYWRDASGQACVNCVLPAVPSPIFWSLRLKIALELNEYLAAILPIVGEALQGSKRLAQGVWAWPRPALASWRAGSLDWESALAIALWGLFFIDWSSKTVYCCIAGPGKLTASSPHPQRCITYQQPWALGLGFRRSTTWEIDSKDPVTPWALS